MLTTVYECDRCGKKDEDNQMQLWTVRISYQAQGSGWNNWSDYRNVDWCRECAVKAGFVGSDKERKEVQAPEPKPTIEELIREIVQHEMEPLHK